MLNYDPRGDLASRDIVSRAIHSEMKLQGNEDIYLDCRHLDPEDLFQRFPHLITHCGEQGLDPTCDLLPIRPAAHYLCGGIQVDRSGRTALDGLLVCGETSRTGLHGANRLASNSLLEAVVFAEQAWEATRDTLGPLPSVEWSRNHLARFTNLRWVAEQRRRVQNIMQQEAGIVRNDTGLRYARQALLQIKEEVEDRIGSLAICTYLIELRNMVLVAGAIVDASLDRSENRGCFYKV